jgi:hypothetical protein
VKNYNSNFSFGKILESSIWRTKFTNTMEAEENKKRKLDDVVEDGKDEKSSYYDIYGPSAIPEIQLKLEDSPRAKKQLKIRVHKMIYTSNQF